MVFATSLIWSTASSQTINSTQPETSATASNILGKMDGLIAALSSLNSEGFKKIDGANARAEELTSRLYELSAGLKEPVEGSKVTSIAKTAESLNNALSTVSASTKALIQQGDDSSETLNKLLVSIQNLGLRKPGLVVRVIEAKFGDTFPDNYVIKKRWCDATAYMRAKCDRSGSCSLDANYQDLVCGFNPAPSADLRDRGLFVDYVCVPNIESSFAGAYNPDKTRSEPVFLRKNRSEYVVLRGNGAIVCGAVK
ncbi:hypothetical protein O3W52_00970 [Ensifer psoraleae]|uniref:Uncharacterized protein n=2 Tax=Sinorhizobium psoraleae TaxID=520838 RepID=A0ABT4KA08_9HYPH|nr:hypothetical protein [Sinorhizobium psoraleae]